ncbi:MAG TPA: hypothetical protein VLB02_00885 [Candidatus Paceibacterota bacterium]|nr:hypothetical protein [Candidatus Paceibacterota bacterium]
MLIQTWSDVFATSLQGLWYGFISTVPAIIIAVIIFIIGWLVGVTLSKAITQLVDALKIDRLFKGAGADDMLARAGWRLHVGKFLGEIVKWFVIIVFLTASLELVGLQQVNSFLRDVVLSYLPQVFIAALVLVIGVILAGAVKRLVSGGAMMANVRSANMLGSISYYAIWIFTILIALNQLGIAPQFMQILFTGIIAMMAVAGGIAFGLGGKEVAGRFLGRLHDDMSQK